jgi:hypothetical protein
MTHISLSGGHAIIWIIPDDIWSFDLGLRLHWWALLSIQIERCIHIDCPPSTQSWVWTLLISNKFLIGTGVGPLEASSRWYPDMIYRHDLKDDLLKSLAWFDSFLWYGLSISGAVDSRQSTSVDRPALNSFVKTWISLFVNRYAESLPRSTVVFANGLDS